MEESRSSFEILTGTPAGKRPLGSPRRRCEENIRTYLKETGVNIRIWIDAVQHRDYWKDLVNMALELRIP